MNYFAYCCINCKKKLNIFNHGICSKCSKKIEKFIYCIRCGSPLPSYERFCGNCIKSPPFWQYMVVVSRHSLPISQLIHRFKYQHQYWLSLALSRLLLLAIYDARRYYQINLPEVIIPVPLHHFRQCKRGYNQSQLLAKNISNLLKIPYRDDLVIRIKNTTAQRGLNEKMRNKNIKKAFILSKDAKNCNYKSIALVDDVITTGATLNEIAKLWYKLGVENIQVWGLTKT